MRAKLLLAEIVACLEAVAAPDLTASLEFVCDPSAARWGTGSAQARSVLDLQVYHDRIFPGMGNWDANSGPVYAMSVNPFTGTCSNEYTMGTESCETIRVLTDGTLSFPATDIRDGHASAGYWFRRNSAGEWSTRKSSFVDSNLSTHIWDFIKFGDRYFAAGYGIASSKDGGVTWTDVNPAWRGKSERFVAFLVCGDELFARTQRSIPYNYKTGEVIVSQPTDLFQYPAIYHHWNKTTEKFDTVTNSYLVMDAGLKRSDFALAYSSLANKASTDGHVWHATPFKDRCLYVLGSGVGILTMSPDYSKTITYSPVGTFPAAAFSAYAENGCLKGQRITLETGAYPYDFTVYGDAAYLLTFKYKSATQNVEHGVWKSTDGINFKKILTFDFQQVMSSLEYHWGYFYFGVAHLNAQPYLGALASGITDKAGSIYRVWCPQASVQGEVPRPVYSGEAGQVPRLMPSGDFAVSLANVVAGATYGVYVTESLSPANWRCVRTVTATTEGSLSFTVETSRAASCFAKVLTEPADDSSAVAVSCP